MVRLGHFVRKRDIILILHTFHNHGMRFIRLLHRARRQHPAAAGDAGGACGGEDVSACWAKIKLQPPQIPLIHPVDRLLALQQRLYADAEHQRQIGKNGNLRATGARLPF